MLLPGEDPTALNGLRRELLDDLQPRNSLEATLIVRMADDDWICDRSEQSAAGRVAMRFSEPATIAPAVNVPAAGVALRRASVRPHQPKRSDSIPNAAITCGDKQILRNEATDGRLSVVRCLVETRAWRLRRR